MMENYTVLHLHSDMSNGVTNIDSCTKYIDYIIRAEELGMKAMAFSEHGSVFAWDLKKEDMEKHGLKYIHAEEFYVTETVDEKIRDNWHCLLIAKNWDGVREINKLASISFGRNDGHYYYAPRITFDDLLHTSDNIIISTACLGGILNRASKDIQERFIKFLSENKHRCFLEIQHHNVAEQIAYNRKLYSISKKYGIRLVAGTDTHSLNEQHAEGRKILQRSKNIFFEDEEGWDLTFKSYDELCEAYKKQCSLPEGVYLEAIENTNVIADMVEPFEIDRHTKYPHIYDNPVETFKKKINEGYKNNKYLKERYPRNVVSSRLKEELAVYEKVGAIDFMLLETYIREWEAKNGIESGYGRGSVSGSLIAYALGITQMDSLKFNLNFFRFMNPSRVTNADIDSDYCSSDREKIKYFLLHDKLNLPNIKTSEIITFNTIAMKGAIKDVCRAFNISLDEAQTISDAVTMDENHKWTIDNKWREKYPEVFKYVDIVYGTIVSIGSHPSGVLVSDRDIESDIGLCSISTSDYPVSMLDMHGLDGQMYVKLDILGLDNIGVINETCRMLGIDRLTPDNVDLNDEKVWKSIRDDTTLIFQWESDSAQAYLKKFMSDETIAKAKEKDPNFSYIKWFSFGNGLIRPSCASFRDDVACGKFYDNGFKELNEFLAPEAGRVAMQETIMMWLQKFCGYSPAESDNVRRAIAKKKGTATLLPEIEQRFIDYSSTHYDITVEKCKEVIKPFLQIILDASAYGFSWNHSDSYSCTGYISGYLRYYYPLQFLTAAFNIFFDKEDKIVNITKYANKIGIPIKDIKFRHSKADYNCDVSENVIYKGIRSIKYMNEDVANKLYDMRDQNFDSFIDVIKVFPGNSRQLDILIKLNYFSEFGKIGTLLRMVDLYNLYGGKKLLKKDKCKLPAELLSKYCTETDKQWRVQDQDGFIKELCGMIPKNCSVPLQSIFNWQQEYLGYISYKDESKKNVGYVLDVNTKYSPKITMYAIDTGSMDVYKMPKKSYEKQPFNKGCLINFNWEQRPKSKLVDGQWQKDYSVMEKWITNYILNVII